MNGGNWRLPHGRHSAPLWAFLFREMKSDMRATAKVLFWVLAFVVAGSVILTEVIR